MLTYDYLAGFLVLIVGIAVIIDADDYPEVETTRDQRFREYEGG